MQCSGCGAAVTDDTAFMTADGAICDQCQADIDIQDLFRKGTLRYVWGAVGLCIVAFIGDPMGIVSVLALVGAVRFFMDFRTKDIDHRKGLSQLGIMPRVVAVLVIITSLSRIAWTALKLLGLGLMALF